MLIARVIGELVSTQKHASHDGQKTLIVQPLNLDGTDRGDAVVAMDAVDAGIGDKVLLITEGFSAMTAVGRPQFSAVAECAVIGVPDDDLGQRIVAVVVPAGPAPDELATELIDLVVAQLSVHKRPREVRFVAALPRNEMGKVQKTRLT